MDRKMSQDLDRHITGNYGEDQFRNEDPFRLCLEDVLEWLETGGMIDGVGFDEKSIIDSIKEVLDV